MNRTKDNFQLCCKMQNFFFLNSSTRSIFINFYRLIKDLSFLGYFVSIRDGVLSFGLGDLEKKVGTATRSYPVVSPLQFLSYQNADSSDITIISYADEITILGTGIDIQVLEERLNNYLLMLSSFLEDWNLRRLHPNHTATVFTTWNI